MKFYYAINNRRKHRVVKSSRLPAKITAFLVSIGQLLCLAFLYGWRFLNKISLDWLLTWTTQPSASKLCDNPGNSLLRLRWANKLEIPVHSWDWTVREHEVELADGSLVNPTKLAWDPVIISGSSRTPIKANSLTLDIPDLLFPKCQNILAP